MQDPTIAAIDAALVARNLPRAELGRRLGIDSSQVTRLFKGKRKLQLHEYRTVAQWLGLPVEQQPSGHVVGMPGLIPLYGWSNPASSYELDLNEPGVRAYVQPHPNQANAKDAFAIEVAHIEMSPRYEPGEIAYALPGRWPSRGQDFLVINTAGEGFIRRFVRREGDTIIAEILSPALEAELSLADIEAIHAIVGRG